MLLLRGLSALAEYLLNAYIIDMTETPEQRKKRLELQAIDGVKAAIEYRDKMAAVVRRTAQLRAERLARQAAPTNAAQTKTVQTKTAKATKR